MNKPRRQELKPTDQQVGDLRSANRRSEEEVGERMQAEQHQAEESRRRHHEDLEVIFNLVPALIFYKDLNNRFVRVNNRLCDTTGLSREQLEGKSAFELFPDGAEECWRDDLEVINSGQPKRNIVEPMVVGDETHWVQTDKIPYRDAKGEIIGIIGFSQDITALKRSEENYRIVADNTNDWEFWIAPSGEFLYASPSCKRITGADVSEFYADPDLVRRIIHPDDLPVWNDHNCAALAGHEVPAVTFRVRHLDSSVRWIEHACRSVHDDHGKFLGVRGSNRDITDRKKAEQELAMANEILEAKHAALREKNLTLKNVLEQVNNEKEKLKAQIQSNVDRTVMPTLRLLRQKVDESTAGYVDLLDSNLHDIASPLTNRLESNYTSLSPGEIAICNMIQNGLTSQEIANLRGVSVQTVSTQRKRIRMKLGIANQSVSLPSLLKSLTH